MAHFASLCGMPHNISTHRKSYELALPQTALCLMQGKHRLEERQCGKIKQSWSGQRGSNPRHQAWEACTLPAELCPPESFGINNIMEYLNLSSKHNNHAGGYAKSGKNENIVYRMERTALPAISRTLAGITPKAMMIIIRPTLTALVSKSTCTAGFSSGFVQ